MSIKPRERIILIAVVLGVAAAAMIYTVLTNKTKPVDQPMVEAFAAASNIPANTVLKPDMLKMSKFPATLPGLAVSQDDLVGKVSSTELAEGHAVLTTNVRPADDMSFMVPPGMRAVTIGLDQVIGVGGFLKRHNRVDVIASFEGDGGAYTRTVLQNVELLALGTSISDEPANKSGKVEGKVQPTATLAVMPHDAEKLLLADSKGKLRLALRRYDDRSVVQTKPLTLSGSARVSTASGGSNHSSAGTQSKDSGAPLITDISIKSLPPITIAGPDGVIDGGTIVRKTETETREVEVIKGTERTVTVVTAPKAVPTLSK